MKWFRTYSDLLHDLKIEQLTDFQFRIYIKLMCVLTDFNSERIKKEVPIGDFIPLDLSKISKADPQADPQADPLTDVKLMPFAQLAKHLQIRQEKLKKALASLENEELISIKNNELVINGWAARQRISDHSDLRVKRHRQAKCNVTNPFLQITDNRYKENVEKKVAKNADRAPPCPYEEIKNLWNQICGSQCGYVNVIGKSRQRHILARWRNELPNLKMWEDLFRRVVSSQLLTGQIPYPDKNRKPFAADLEWVCLESRFLRIMEGKYDDKY